MREILFKAKRKDNGEWIYGYYIKNPYNKHFILECVDKRYKKWEHKPLIEIIPETVCQYTGLDDKNGVRIFKNDIVEANYLGYGKYKYIVDFSDFELTFKLKDEKYENEIPYRRCCLYDFEVIESIFDKEE